jgi:hypothetical protein
MESKQGAPNNIIEWTGISLLLSFKFFGPPLMITLSYKNYIDIQKKHSFLKSMRPLKNQQKSRLIPQEKINSNLPAGTAGAGAAWALSCNLPVYAFSFPGQLRRVNWYSAITGIFLKTGQNNSVIVLT